MVCVCACICVVVCVLMMVCSVFDFYAPAPTMMTSWMGGSSSRDEDGDEGGVDVMGCCPVACVVCSFGVFE